MVGDQTILLILSTYFAIATIGYLFDRYLKMPWMFTVVVFAMFLSGFGLFKDVFQSESFQFLAEMGMLLFLFTIGIDLNLEEIRKLGRYIILGGTLLPLVEGTLIAAFFYSVFPAFVSYSFPVALLAGIAFGTIGEVVLLAILKQFGVENTRFGQLALGLGVFDDIFEFLVLCGIVVFPTLATTGEQSHALGDVVQIMLTLAGIIIATIVLARLGDRSRKLLERVDEKSFVLPFAFFLVIFSFIYFSSTKFGDLGVIAAIFSGIAVKQVMPKKFVEQYKRPIFFVANIFLGPFFFLKVGGGISFTASFAYLWVVAAIVLISLLSRMLVSYLVFREAIGGQQSVILGIGLCTKFSTSIVSENLLFTSGLIAGPLYSVIMLSYVVMKPVIIGVFSRGLATVKHTLS